ncbi:MAG TPA: trypsin-like serine protease [Nitrobacter sp.]|jgi:secreted trypsin-like serine protease|nr:trypsin-like serine protease [Nitrobacter sp.]
MTRQNRLAVALLVAALAPPASAMVGGGGAPSPAVANAIVTIVGSHGTSCTGTLIARDIILTAAHCIAPGTTYKMVDYNTRPPRLLDIRRVAAHPQFNMQSLLAHRATADVALLQLAAPLSTQPAKLGGALMPITASMRLTVVGMGVAVRGDGRSGGVARAASLAVTGRPGTLQIRLVDPITNNARAGLGACTGDSGAPAFLDSSGGSTIVGVVSWSTGPNNASGCGGLTGVTPLALYRDWILRTARSWGAGM